MQFSGQVAIVTGAAEGIGFATSRALAREGASVVMVDTNVELLRAASEEILDSGGTAVPVGADVAKEQDVAELVRVALGRFGRIDILINNAAIDVKKPLIATTGSDWDAVMAVNLRGPFLCGKAVAPHMMEEGVGVILNVASVVAVRSEANFGAYCTSKAGLLGLTRSMVIEWSPRGIRVNCLLPGPVDSAMKWRWVAAEERSMVRQQSERLVPLGRIGTPEEIAEGAVWLCSRGARFASGCFMELDGGWMAGR